MKFAADWFLVNLSVFRYIFTKLIKQSSVIISLKYDSFMFHKEIGIQAQTQHPDTPLGTAEHFLIGRNWSPN